MKHQYIDLDETLIPFDSLPRFVPPFLAWLGPKGWTTLLGMPVNALPSRRDRIRPAVAAALRGRRVDEIDTWCADWVSRIILPKLRRHLVPVETPFSICSMSLDIVVEPIARSIGGDAIGTPLSRTEGRFDGVLAGPPCGGPGKRQYILEDCERRGLDPADVGLLTDHHRDIEALEAVGHPELVNPSAKLREWARGRDVPVRPSTPPTN